ncbi:UNVERIFIED_CONTAM: hypothetical protein K2H54_060746 [Gekko kuhli]
MKFYGILPFVFATEEINKKQPRILPNITLGYNVYENYLSTRFTSDAVVDLLSGGQKNVPNYICGGHNNLLAVLDGTDSKTSNLISTILSIYKIPHISYDLDNQVLKDDNQLPFFYRLAPKQDAYFMGIVKMLLHFRWTWISLLAPDDDKGERFLRTLTSVVIRNGICVVFTETIPELNLDKKLELHEYSFFKKTKCNVVVYYGDFRSIITLGMMIKYAEMIGKSVAGKVWISAILHDLSLRYFFKVFDIQHIHGSFSFLIQKTTNTKYDNKNSFASALEKIGKGAFNYFYSGHRFSVKAWLRQREKEVLEAPSQDYLGSILSQDSYSIYNSIQVVAHALNAASLSRSNQMLSGGWLGLQKVKPWQVFLLFENVYQLFKCSVTYLYLEKFLYTEAK